MQTMVNGFLYNNSIVTDSPEEIEEGFIHLHEIADFCRKEHSTKRIKIARLFKDEDIGDMYSKICSVLDGPFLSFVAQVLEQDFSNQKSPRYFSKEEIDIDYTNSKNCFVGINFNDTNLDINDCATCLEEFRKIFIEGLEQRNSLTEEDQCVVLESLYPDYVFEIQAVADTFYWNKKNRNNYFRLHELLKDVSENPHVGGHGKTEPLKNRPGFSKRITGKDRLIYTHKNNTITVISCKGHYE